MWKPYRRAIETLQAFILTCLPFLAINGKSALRFDIPTLKLYVGVTTGFTGLTALTIEAIVADDAALTTNVTVIGSAGAVPVASLTTPGQRVVLGLNPRIASKGQRYLGVRYTPTGTGTAGALIAELGTDIADGQKFYPVGFAVL